MEISDLFCKNSIWRGEFANFDYVGTDSNGVMLRVGSTILSKESSKNHNKHFSSKCNSY